LRETQEINTSNQSEAKFNEHFGPRPCMESCTWIKKLLQLQTFLHIHSQNLAHFESANCTESRKFIFTFPSHQTQKSEKKMKYTKLKQK